MEGPMGWLCICDMGDGTTERSEWITQDGADQMASEMEAEGRRARRRVRCRVEPMEGDGGGEAAAAAEAGKLAAWAATKRAR
jgi:hypothetical protein